MPVLGRYLEPHQVASQDVVGRLMTQVYADNDEYFMGLARGQRPISKGSWVEPTGATTIWQGYHYYHVDGSGVPQNDQMYCGIGGNIAAVPVTISLRYSAGTSGDPAANEFTVYDHQFNYSNIGDNVNVIIGDYLSTRAALEGYTIADGLHRVRVTCGDVSGANLTTAWSTAPYSFYTGLLTYATPYKILDGMTSAVSHFNRWRSNDMYFYANRPMQPACVATDNSSYSHAWMGWNQHWYNQMVVDVWGGPEENDVIITYNEGGTTEEELRLEHPGGSYSGNWYHHVRTWDLSTGWEKGWYPVLVRSGGDPAGHCHVNRLYMAPAGSMPSAYHTLAEFTPGNFVYGSAGTAQLDYLSENDKSILEPLVHSGPEGRTDYAVRQTTATQYEEYWLKRQYDTLYYRTLGASIEWEYTSSVTSETFAESASLEDATSTDHYQTLDLRSLDGLDIGMVYRIRHAGGAQDGLYYAAEW